jgi:hypothetical protein
LRFLSIDPKWLKPGKAEAEFFGYPYVGYCAKPHSQMIVLRVEELEHLLAVVERAQVPSHDLLRELFVSRNDFRAWLQAADQTPPAFWFSYEEQQVEG